MRMRRAKVILMVLLAAVLFLFLDYVLPSRETVRITNTYNRLTDLGVNRVFFASPDTGTVQNAAGQRDIRFIDTVRRNGKPLVYRNEDTGVIWPPYFKYDSSNLQAVATDRRSTAEAAKWVSMTSYGWRISWLSIYPNALSIRPVAGSEAAPVNWLALVILGALGLLLLLLWRALAPVRARQRARDLTRQDAGWVVYDARMDAARGKQATPPARRWRGWMDSWRR